MNLTKKYIPKTPEEFVGNPDVVKDTIDKISDGMNVIITGDSGTGKTALAYIVGNKLNMDIVEITPSDCSTALGMDAIEERIQTKTLFGETLFLFDEAEFISNKNKLLNIIKASIHPVILTVNDLYLIPYGIKKICKTEELKTPTIAQVTKRIKEIAKKENIPLNKINFTGVTSDIRSSILACFDSSRKMKKPENDFNRTRKAFVDHVQVDLNPAWLMDNVHNFYHGMDVHEAIQILTYAIETNDNYFYTCLPETRGGKANYPYYLRRK